MSTHSTIHAQVFRDHYLRAKEPEFFDTVDHDFARRTGPRYEQSRAYNTAVYVGIASSASGRLGIYCAGSISKGMLANAWVKTEAPFNVKLDDGVTIKAHHVYDLDETIGSQNFTDKVLRQNRRIQLQKLSLLNILMPDSPVLAPIALQGAISVAGTANFDQGAKRRDKDYMQVWTPVIRELTNVILIAGDGFFSGATSGLEYPEAIAVAAGLRLKRRPNADMRFLDMNKKDVTLFEMSRRYAEYLLWAADSGDFYLKHEPTALMRNFSISTMAERGGLPKADPIFMEGISKSLTDMKYLQREIEPLILDRVKARMFELDTSDMASSNPQFVEQVAAIRAGGKRAAKITVPRLNNDVTTAALANKGISIHRFTDEELLRGDFEFREIARLVTPENYADFSEPAATRRIMRAVDMRGDATQEYDGKSLFSRALLPLMTDREKLLTSVVLGSLETIRPNPGRYYFIVADDKYGVDTSRAKDTLNLAHADEVPGRTGSTFKDIKVGNRALTLAVQREMVMRDIQVLSSLDLQQQLAVIAKNVSIAVAPGEAKIASPARALARHAFMARNITDFIFLPGWESSNDGVQDMVLATRMQMGLQAGAAIEPQHVRVFNEQKHYLTLAARTSAIWGPLRSALEKGRDAKDLDEPATALAQLWALHRLASDHTMRLRVFDRLREKDGDLDLPKDIEWDRVSPFLFAYDHKAHEKLWQQEIKPTMESSLIMVVRMRHLEHIDDFMAMRGIQEARLSIAKAGRPEHRSQRRRMGGAVPT